MLKPVLVIVATMCLSWGLAFAVNAVRPGDPANDVAVECGYCGRQQFSPPAPLYSCRHCGRIQTARSITAE